MCGHWVHNEHWLDYSLILNGPMVVLSSHLIINHCLVMRMFFLICCLLTLGRHKWTFKNVASRPHPHKTQVDILIDLENVASPPPTQDTSGHINRHWKCCNPTTPHATHFSSSNPLPSLGQATNPTTKTYMQ
jgi:hypothetical protein